MLCKVLSGAVHQDDLIFFIYYNLPAEWQQMLMLTCAFLLLGKQKKSTLFVHGPVDIGKSYFFDGFSFLRPFASGEANTGNFCWNSLVDHHFLRFAG